MAHDVPLGCAPDEYDDLISGTCSHLPYVYAYFQEDQLNRIKKGQKTVVTLLNDKIRFNGSVESISKGILDYSNKGSQGELHEVNPTFEWVRLPMRIPVRIAIPSNQDNYDLLVSGMTCTVTISENHEKL
ncbi:fusaric acid resistance protein [Enterobacter cloacae subsp. cloacae]|nr:fusaric acid resistance protein [Enterobacter cloacae subsp. cloacae]